MHIFTPSYAKVRKSGRVLLAQKEIYNLARVPKRCLDSMSLVPLMKTVSQNAFPTSRCRSADTVTWVLKFSIDIYSKDMQKIMQGIMEKFVIIISF